MVKKRVLRIISFLLSLTILNQCSGYLIAQAESNQLYISDISVGGISELEAAGYTVVNENINEGGTPVYIGYKYTKNADEAITDVAAMSMYGGYSPLSYKDQLINDSQGVIELGTMIKNAAAEFGKNYAAGNPYAILAYNTLNAMYFPDERGNNTPLGDFLLTDVSISDCKKIALMSSNVVMSFILNQLCLGVADTFDNTWLDRLSSNGPFIFIDENGECLDEGNINEIYSNQYDNLYMQRAHKLYVAVSQFSSNYAAASERSGSIEEIIPDEQTAVESVDKVCEAINEGGTIEFDDISDKTEDENKDNYGDFLPLSVYALLDAKDENGNPEYPYGTKNDGTVRTLAEFFIEVGNMEDGEDAYRLLYPLIASQNEITPMTAGQEIMTYLVGLEGMVSVGASDSDALDYARTTAEEQVRGLLEVNGGNRLSIWYDINLDIYDESQDGVYWTSDFVREAAAHDRYDLLSKPTGIKEVDIDGQLKNYMIYLGCVAIGCLGAAMVTSKILGAAVAIKGIVAMVSCAVNFLASTTIAYSTAVCVSCVLGTVFLAILVIALIAILVIALIRYFGWLEDDEPELELKEIPKTIYDYNDAGEGSAVIYRAVTAPGKSTGTNLNAGLSNTPWVVLYYTKDVTLGAPITAELEGDTTLTAPIYFSKGNQNPNEGYCPLKAFGSVTAANLNEGRSGVKALFGFFHREGGAVPEYEKQGKYLSEIKLTSASGKGREEKAKTELINSGYAVIDYNLTSDSGLATYIGYKTSDDSTDAITDLRVAYATGLNPNSATIKYGAANYGCCGNVGNLLLMETKYSNAGTPILADSIIITDTLGDAPAGYEPVNLFCGGPAFDFNNCDNWEMTSPDDGKESSDKWKNHIYIYFNPSVQYTSGVKYLGGLAFFSGNTDSYISDSGWTPLNNTNLKNGQPDTGITYDISGVQDGKTILCYSTTYNPYRAIYDIQYYGAEASAQGLPYNLYFGIDGAVVCDVFQQSGGGVGNNRTIRITHAYRSNNWYEGGGYYNEKDYIDRVGDWKKFTNEAKYVEWYNVNGTETASSICCTGLFVVGKKTTSSDPIRISELEISSSSEYDSSIKTPVRPITDYYAKQGANLAFNDMYHSGNMYIYIYRADVYAVIPEYIQSVTVADVKGYDLDKNDGSKSPYDSAVYSLLGNGAGRLMEVSLTGSKNWKENTSQYEHGIYSDSGYYETYYGQQVTCLSHGSDYEVALVWVTYTNSRTKGISDIVIYESSDGTIPTTVKTADGNLTETCGSGFRVGGKGKTYYLCAVYNAGNQITDLIIDKDIMLRNYWTSINTEGKASNYETYYIKAEHFRKATMTYYISGIYTATGSNQKEALKSLLNQGCRYYCPFNLSPDGKTPLYVGYSLSTSYKNAYSGLILQDNGQDNTVDKIIKGRDTYIRVTDSLNSGVYDSLICMYLTNSVRKACETGGTKASNGHYITDITFYTDTDLNDYATGKKSLDNLDAKTKAYIEDYIFDEDGNQVNWDIVTDSGGNIINCNVTAIKGGTLSESAPKVYMYIHYSDNKTPYLSSLSGSLFSKNIALSIIIIAGTGLLLHAAIYLILKKKKHVNAVADSVENKGGTENENI